MMLENLFKEKDSNTSPGRKFAMGRLVIILATLAFVSAALSPALATNLGTFLWGLTGLFATYCGGNVGADLVANRPTTKVVLDRRKATRIVEDQPEESEVLKEVK